MSYYEIKYENIRQDKSMAEILNALERGFRKFNIDYYLVGALARDVWMSGIHNIQPRRATSDIDFGIMIKNSTDFTKLKEYLVKEEEFTPYRENSFVLIWKDKRQVDLLPFGAIEKEGRVAVKGTGLTTINVDGFKEVYAEGLPEVQIEESTRFKFCTLPGIVILKLIAQDDRPDVRRVDDITDVADILFHFFKIFDEHIWEQHNDLFGDTRELIDISAQVLGREMGKILKRNTELGQRVLNILIQVIDSPASSSVTDIISRHIKEDETTVVLLLKSIAAGIRETM